MTDWPPIISAIAGSVSALAGAAAAGAAWFAAVQSRAAAQDVRQALGISMKPHLDVVGNAERRYVGAEPPLDVYLAKIRNRSLWAAVDVEIEAVLRDGSKLLARVDRIDGAETKDHTREVKVDLGAPPGEPSGLGVTEAGKRTVMNIVTMRYRDERRLLRWEYVWTETIQYTYDPDKSRGSGTSTSSAERMIES